MADYYNREMDPWARTADNIGQIFAQRARNQYQARERAAMAERQMAQLAETKRVNDARVGEITESTRKTKLEADSLEKRQQAQQELAAWVRTNIIRNADGSLTVRPEGAAEMGQFMSGMVGSSSGGNDAALAFKNSMGTFQAPVEAEKNRASREEIATQNRKAADARATMDTVTTEYPGTEGTPDVPGKPAGTGLFGTGLFARPAVPPVKGTPGTPGKRVVRKVPRGTELAVPLNPEDKGEATTSVKQAQQSQDPDDSDQAAPTKDGGTSGNAYADALVAEANRAMAKGAPRDKVLAELNAKLKPFGLSMK